MSGTAFRKLDLFRKKDGIWVPAGIGSGAAAGVCTLFDECTGEDDNTSSPETSGYVGQTLYTPAAAMNVCQIDVNFTADPAANVVVGVYLVTNVTDIGTAVCTKTEAVAAAGWHQFEIVGDCIMANGVEHIIAARVVGGSVTIFDSATLTLNSGYLARWDSAGVEAGSWAAYDVGIRIYTIQ